MTIELYTAGTPNGQKISIMLEEIAIDYIVHPINFSKGEQKQPEFLAINPNGKIPAIVDTQGVNGQPISIFESGAILIYLAEKSGKLLSTEPRQRMETIEWLMFQMAGVGPMFGQLGYFSRSAPVKIELAIDRYTNEAKRLLSVLDKRLSEAEFLVGDYSIADLATFPWVNGHEYLGLGLDEVPHVRRWLNSISARPAVQRGLKVPQG
jgi:GSH-dependent disulfide-bond oxidoreductase